MDLHKELADLESRVAVVKEMIANQGQITEADIGRLVMVGNDTDVEWLGPFPLCGFSGDWGKTRFIAGGRAWHQAKLYHGTHHINMKPYKAGDEVPKLESGETYCVFDRYNGQYLTVGDSWKPSEATRFYAILKIHQ